MGNQNSWPGADSTPGIVLEPPKGPCFTAADPQAIPGWKPKVGVRTELDVMLTPDGLAAHRGRVY